MKSYTYYLVSYYARLKAGGFGFGREYVAVAPDTVFDIDKFEGKVAKRAGLSHHNIALISRIPVTAEEYSFAKSKERQHVNELESINEQDIETESSQVSPGEVRPELAGSPEVNPNGEQAEGTPQEA